MRDVRAENGEQLCGSRGYKLPSRSRLLIVNGGERACTRAYIPPSPLLSSPISNEKIIYAKLRDGTPVARRLAAIINYL